MTLPTRAFSGSSFFFDIRSAMLGNRGMFAGSDGGLCYACMDASFYRFEILQRPSTQTFTQAATTLTPDVRVVANGQIFGTSYSDYCLLGPCSVQWQGEIISSHAIKTGRPASRPDHRHFGQWDGRSELAFGSEKGDPSSVTSPGSYNYALGTLIPLVAKGTPFGPLEVRDATGKIVQHASPGGIGSWISEPPSTGKVVYGLHRGAQVIFVLAQRNRAPDGLDIMTLIGRLVSMGVADAVMGDGSNSATLVVDSTVEVEPADYKNDSIPTGVMFRLQALKLRSTSTLTNSELTTDPQFQHTFFVNGTSGTVRQTNAGIDITINSLGSNAQFTSAQLAAALGVTLPITLRASSSLLTAGVNFAGVPPSGNVDGVGLVLTSTATAHGRLTGRLRITNTRGVVVFDADWPVEP